MKQSKKGDDSLWQKTQYANLVRYKPSKTYFARICIGRKLIRRTLFAEAEVTRLFLSIPG
jgi:hypothetical protein